MNKSNAPQIISLSAAEVEKLLGELRGPLAPATYQMVEALLRTLQWVLATLEQKTATLGRLRRMIFGEKTEKACKILPRDPCGDPLRASQAQGQRTRAQGGQGLSGRPASSGASS